MDISPTCALILSGKTAADNETAKLLKRNDTSKLPDDTEISVFLHSERDEFLEENGFRIDSYLNALSTNTFGRFLLLRISFLSECNDAFLLPPRHFFIL